MKYCLLYFCLLFLYFTSFHPIFFISSKHFLTSATSLSQTQNFFTQNDSLWFSSANDSLWFIGFLLQIFFGSSVQFFSFVGAGCLSLFVKLSVFFFSLCLLSTEDPPFHLYRSKLFLFFFFVLSLYRSKLLLFFFKCSCVPTVLGYYLTLICLYLCFFNMKSVLACEMNVPHMCFFFLFL
jgi:hypothetical protein